MDAKITHSGGDLDWGRVWEQADLLLKAMPNSLMLEFLYNYSDDDALIEEINKYWSGPKIQA